MEMFLAVKIEKLVTKLRLAPERTDNIKAFGELWIYPVEQSEPLFKVKGFTIRLKEFTSSGKVLTVDFPAYGSSKSKTGFQTSFVTESKALLQDIRNLFLQEFEQASEGLSAEEVVRSESEQIADEELKRIGKEIDKQNNNPL